MSRRFLVLGDNGSGKSALLQAIALPLELATRQMRKVSHFAWIGFIAGRYSSMGKPHIELSVSFTDPEIDATRTVAQEWYGAQGACPTETVMRSEAPGLASCVQSVGSDAHSTIGFLMFMVVTTDPLAGWGLVQPLLGVGNEFTHFNNPCTLFHLVNDDRLPRIVLAE